MLRADGGDVRVGGNIGEALIGLVPGSTPATRFAVEVSSFQLEGIRTFRPDVAVFLNLSEDHLDRHSSFAEYAAAKGRIFENQGPEDWAVVNADDPRVLEMARASRSRALRFHPAGPAPANEPGAYFESGEARLRTEAGTETLFALSTVQLPGPHLAGDLLAAAAAARALGAAPSAIARAVASFRGAEHVLEYVATVNKVEYFNDSKATNVVAARRSVEAFRAPVLLILGGRYKGGDFAELAPVLRDHGKAVLAIGEAQERVALSLRGVLPVHPCGTLAEAVAKAVFLAVPGDIVLLAPACSSFDMYLDYAARGRAFKEEVLRLTHG
jgi:UDP-N-acetylmuramoylalanine--D-glutamate ligase